MTPALRLLIYDRTCRGRAWMPLGLSHVWGAGSWLYRGLQRLELARGVSSWTEALDWLATVRPPLPIAEIQWSHGRWGSPRIGLEPLERDALREAHPHHRRLCAVRERLAGPGALFWLSS